MYFSGQRNCINLSQRKTNENIHRGLTWDVRGNRVGCGLFETVCTMSPRVRGTTSAEEKYVSVASSSTMSTSKTSSSSLSLKSPFGSEPERLSKQVWGRYLRKRKIMETIEPYSNPIHRIRKTYV